MTGLSLLAAALLVATAYSAQAADWTMDAGTSRLEFAATFEKTIAPGVFRQFDTRMRLDADKPVESRLDVTIVVKSADMNSADVNKAISGAEWFDFARFPFDHRKAQRAQTPENTQVVPIVERGGLGSFG